MTQIPVVPVRAKRGEMISGTVTFNGTSVILPDTDRVRMRYADVMSSLSKTYGKDLPLVVVDVDGL
ncbi:MAG: hypothetical protein FWG58_02320, partial [Methanomassiliicoccaceae archaeon]|nr:hypothetical protein [Methanomassiliicoccaceae archaeon]